MSGIPSNTFGSFGGYRPQQDPPTKFYTRQPNFSEGARPESKSLTMLLTEGAQRAKQTVVWVATTTGTGGDDALSKEVTRFSYAVELRRSDNVSRSDDTRAVGRSMASKQAAKHAAAAALLTRIVDANMSAGHWRLPGATTTMAMQFLESRVDDLFAAEVLAANKQKEMHKLSVKMAKECAVGNGKPTQQPVKKCVETDPQANSVAQLHTLCQQMNLVEPTYVDTTDASTQSAVLPSFAFAVRLGDLAFDGTAGSKRDAKRRAAEQMLAIVRALRSAHPHQLDARMAAFAASAAAPLSAKTDKPAVAKVAKPKRSKWVDELRKTPGATLASLRDASCLTEQAAADGFDAIAHVQRIVDEHSALTVEYIPLTRRCDGEHHTQLHLHPSSSSSTTVFYGHGRTTNDAARSAAHGALHYVRTLVFDDDRQATNMLDRVADD